MMHQQVSRDYVMGHSPPKHSNLSRNCNGPKSSTTSLEIAQIGILASQTCQHQDDFHLSSKNSFLSQRSRTMSHVWPYQRLEFAEFPQLQNLEGTPEQCNIPLSILNKILNYRRFFICSQYSSQIILEFRHLLMIKGFYRAVISKSPTYSFFKKGPAP